MKIIGKEDKWLLISCLQKSIRKGFEALAINYAEKLYDLDLNYLIHRLSVIAIEDIGLANTPLVYEFLSNQNNKEIVLQKGGKNYILKCVSEFSKSVKDRSATELNELANLTPPLNIYDTDCLKNIFTNSSLPIVNRLLAGWELLDSKKMKNSLIKNENEDLENFIELNSQVVKNKEVMEILKNAYVFYRKPHFIGLGLLSVSLENEKCAILGRHKTGSVIEKSFNAKMVDNKWLIDGIDWHTKEGKVAIDYFLLHKTLTLENLKRLSVPFESMAAAIGMLMFRYNGHEVDKRLVYPTAVVILKITQKNAFQKLINNKEADIVAIIKNFSQDYSLLEKEIENSFKSPDPKFFPF